MVAMVAWSFVLVLALTGCGRIGFGAIGAAGDSGDPGDAGDDTRASPDAALIPAGPLVWLKMDTGPVEASSIRPGAIRRGARARARRECSAFMATHTASRPKR